jgi:hypothetical protein
VSIPNPANGQVLTYDSASGKWVALTPASGTDMATVWANLAASDASKQIDISHLTTALSGYLPLTGGTMSNTNLVTNMNADLLDGHHSTYFVNDGTTWEKTLRQDGFIVHYTADYSSTSDNPFSIIGGNAATVIQVLPEHQTYGAQLAFGFGSARLVWRCRTGSTQMSEWTGIIAASADYATSAGDAATLGGTAKDGLFTDFSNITTGADAGKVGITIGGTTRALSVDAATLGGTAKSGLFTSLTSTWATNLSATIGGTTLSVSSLKADYAGQLRYSRSIWGQSFNGTADVSGDLYLAGSNLRLFDYNNSADCYIVGYRTGSSRAIGVAVEGSSLFEFNDEEFYSAVGIYAASYVTALSDIRYKNVIRHFALDAETIANASLIQFKWIDGRDQATHVGGIAQEWQAFLPEAVHETKDGKLSMDYGVIAYTAAVSLAKKVVAQQHEIDDLKQRLERLERIIDKVTK